MSEKTLIVEDAQEVRLDRYLRRLYPALNQGVLEKLLRKGQIRIDGAKVKSSTRVSDGQEVNIQADLEPYSQREEKPVDEKRLSDADVKLLESMVIWEDDDLLVLNKPAGLATQGGSGVRKHLAGLMKAWGRKKEITLRLTHRLDRDTSGVIVIAKTATVAAHVTQCFREKTVQKTYWAIVRGVPEPGQGVIRASLVKKTGRPHERVFVDKKEGKKSVTEYKILKKMAKNLTWVELLPQTGRTHQLRVHMEHIKTPILGDEKYGYEIGDVGKEKNLHLHARSIAFTDATGAKLAFTAPPPEHFEKLFKANKIDIDRHA